MTRVGNAATCVYHKWVMLQHMFYHGCAMLQHVSITGWTYSAFEKFSDPLTFSTFSYITALFSNGLNKYLFLSMYTQYCIITMLKQGFRNFCKCIKKLKYLIYISTQTLRKSFLVYPVSIDHPCDVSRT